jgi:hypothetical protein
MAVGLAGGPRRPILASPAASPRLICLACIAANAGGLPIVRIPEQSHISAVVDDMVNTLRKAIVTDATYSIF